MTSIAAPVFGADGEIAAALSVLAPTYRTSADADRRCAGGRSAAHAGELSREPRRPGVAVAA